MKLILKQLLFILLLLLLIISNVYANNASCVSPQDWSGVSAPLAVESRLFRVDEGAGLGIELTSCNSLGTWVGNVAVTGAAGCRITGEAEISLNKDSSDSLDPGNDCMILVSWFQPDKKNPCQRDYVDFTDSVNERKETVRRFDQTFTVPENCTKVKFECMFKWRRGTVVFRQVQSQTVPAPAPRLVRVVAANPHPSHPCTIEGNLDAMEQTLKSIVENIEKPDLILFAECFTDSGTGRGIPDSAETIPDGPTFQLFSRYAKQYRVWIVGNVHEVTSEKIYHNTAFLVDRNGQLSGVYRKAHLTSSEFQKGVIPGRELPVFKTDFGTIGIVVCWDNWFSETAKILRLKGAELLLFPLAGDGKESHWSIIWSARAIDSSVPMIVATQQAHLPAAIVDRDGEWLGQTTEKNGFVCKDLDLNERKRSFWLSVGPSMGDPYQLYKYERRPAAYK